MTELFGKNHYRTSSSRLSGYNYSSAGIYFITICTENHERFFGDIINGQMVLSEIGKIVYNEWEKSFDIRAELMCDKYIIMPNHIHGILVITGSGMDLETHGRDVSTVSKSWHYGFANRAKKSISSFVAGFKSSATKQINEFRKTPGIPIWQPRFHDHIIRNEVGLKKIREYIDQNPINWAIDSENPEYYLFRKI